MVRGLSQFYQIGIKSLPLVALIGFFSGALIAWQAAYQFKGLITLSIMGGQVFRVLVMEIAPVLTSLIIGGKLGVEITTYLGLLQITEQLFVLKALGISPWRYIVLPRLGAVVFALPVLGVYANLFALLGAYQVSHYTLGLTAPTFWGSVQEFFAPRDVIGGLIKMPFYGAAIVLISSWHGLRPLASLQAVSNASVRASVYATLCILFLDYLFWPILF